MITINTNLNGYTPLADTSGGSSNGAGNAARALDRDAVVRAVSASNAVASVTGDEAVLLDLSPAAQEYLKALQAKASEEKKGNALEIAPAGAVAE